MKHQPGASPYLSLSKWERIDAVHKKLTSQICQNLSLSACLALRTNRSLFPSLSRATIQIFPQHTSTAASPEHAQTQCQKYPKPTHTSHNSFFFYSFLLHIHKPRCQQWNIFPWNTRWEYLLNALQLGAGFHCTGTVYSVVVEMWSVPPFILCRFCGAAVCIMGAVLQTSRSVWAKMRRDVMRSFDVGFRIPLWMQKRVSKLVSWCHEAQRRAVTMSSGV